MMRNCPVIQKALRFWWSGMTEAIESHAFAADGHGVRPYAQNDSLIRENGRAGCPEWRILAQPGIMRCETIRFGWKPGLGP
jgi:hypothetical protein